MTGRDLVDAVCHEAGNLLAAIRLQAHLIDSEAGPRALAAASIEIEDLSDRAGALLALIGPLLDPAPGASARLGGLFESLGASAGGWARGARVEVVHAAADALPPLPLAAHVLEPLLTTLLLGAIDEARPNGQVRLSARLEGREVWIELEDDGSPDESPESWLAARPRGRPLGLALAQVLTASVGGGAEATRSGEPARTRVRVRLPALAG